MSMQPITLSTVTHHLIFQPNSEKTPRSVWGSGGRGFKSRRPDSTSESTVGIYADGAFSFLPAWSSFGRVSPCL